MSDGATPASDGRRAQHRRTQRLLQRPRATTAVAVRRSRPGPVSIVAGRRKPGASEPMAPHHHAGDRGTTSAAAGNSHGNAAAPLDRLRRRKACRPQAARLPSGTGLMRSAGCARHLKTLARPDRDRRAVDGDRCMRLEKRGQPNHSACHRFALPRHRRRGARQDRTNASFSPNLPGTCAGVGFRWSVGCAAAGATGGAHGGVAARARTGRAQGPRRTDRKAGDGTRTRDIQLGKLTLYQLSYTRSEADTIANRWRRGARRADRGKPPRNQRETCASAPASTSASAPGPHASRALSPVRPAPRPPRAGTPPPRGGRPSTARRSASPAAPASRRRRRSGSRVRARPRGTA